MIVGPNLPHGWVVGLLLGDVGQAPQKERFVVAEDVEVPQLGCRA